MEEARTGRAPIMTDEMLVKIAWWYHVDGLTQDQIAARLDMSRASVGRMIERAKTAGITQIRIAPEYLSRAESARAVKEAFGLRDVVLVPEEPAGAGTGMDPATRLGIAASQVLLAELPKCRTLAIGWGEMVSKVISIIANDELSEIRIVSLTGGVNDYANALHMIRSRGGSSVISDLTPTPLYVSSERLAQALLSEESVAATLERARAADVAIIGIGAPTTEASLSKMGVSTPAELAQARERGGVGDLLAMFYDEAGQPVPLERDRRRIGVDIGALRDIPTVIAVAGGQAKHQAILGALRGGYVDVLVTDVDTAKFLRAAAGGASS